MENNNKRLVSFRNDHLNFPKNFEKFLIENKNSELKMDTDFFRFLIKKIKKKRFFIHNRSFSADKQKVKKLGKLPPSFSKMIYYEFVKF